MSNKNAKIFSLAYNEDKNKITNLLKCDVNQINIITDKKAKDFFEQDLKLQIFENLFESNENVIF